VRRPPSAADPVAERSGLGAQPVDGTGGGELGCAQPFDEIAAADPSGVLEPGQHPVGSGESARHPLGHHRAPGHHAVPFQQHLGKGVGSRGAVDLAFGQQGPAPGRDRRPGSAGHRRPATGSSGGS
jgi:hypothetical protein